MDKLDTLQAVELAEGVEIRLRVAGPMLRAAAFGLDLLIRGAILIAAGILFFIGGFSIAGMGAIGLWLLLWFLLDWIYPVIFEAGKRGATPGKRAMGLRVVQESGAQITIGQAVVRNFLRFIDGMPLLVTYGIGTASCLATRRFQRLGDLAAGTVVVYERVPAMPAVPAPPPLQAIPVPLALTADEARALVLFGERAGLWSEARRNEIAAHVEPLSGASGPEGVSRVLAMAHWLQEKREGTA